MMVDDDTLFGEVVRVDGVNAYLARSVSRSSRELGVGEFVGVECGGDVVVSVLTGVERSIPEDVVSMISLEMESKYLPYSSELESSYYRLFGLGLLSRSGVQHGLRVAPRLRSRVWRLDDDTIRKFHLPHGRANISYFNRYREALGDDLLLAIVDELWALLPEAHRMLAPVRKYLKGGGAL